MNRQLAGFCLEQRAAGGHDVTQIPVLERAVHALGHAVVVDVQLDATARRAERGILQGRKTGLAHHAFEHHAASHADLDRELLQVVVGLVAILGKQRFGTVLGFDVVGKGDARAA